MGRKDALRDLAAALHREDWRAVLDLGLPWLRAPSDARAIGSVQLAVGRAHFMLGQNAEAVELLEAGSDAAPSGADLTEACYFAGMAAMMNGDLDRSRALLQRSLARPDTGSWAIDAARRGLAQVEVELGNFDDALRVMAMLPQTPDSQLLHLVILARIHQRAGRADEARRALGVVSRVMAEMPEDLPATEAATLAGMQASVAAVYLALGHPREAEAALDGAARSLGAVGGIETPAATYTALFRAEVRRLDGDLAGAEQLLDGCEGLPRLAEDITPMFLRTRARVLWDRDDRHRATALWEQAAAAFETIGYRWQAGDARREAVEGPPVARPYLDAEPGTGLPDAVLVRFRLPDPDVAGSILELAHRLEDLVTAAGIGEFDGWEAGGGEFVVYCYGDPDGLWSVLEDPVRTSGWDGVVVLRRDGEEIEIAFG